MTLYQPESAGGTGTTPSHHTFTRGVAGGQRHFPARAGFCNARQPVVSVGFAWQEVEFAGGGGARNWHYPAMARGTCRAFADNGWGGFARDVRLSGL